MRRMDWGRTKAPVRRAARVFAAAVVCGCLLGCAFRVSRAGDPGFLERELGWKPGVTLAREVSARLGPPDWIAGSPERLVFVYRFQQDVSTSLVLNLYLKLFSSQRVRRVDGTLLAVFDEDDRLLYYGSTAAPGSALREAMPEALGPQ